MMDEAKDEKGKGAQWREMARSQLQGLPLKMVILSFSSGVICVFPFLVLQMKILGLTINEIAILYLVIPIAALLGPIFSGMVADKIGKYSLVFVCNIILATLCYNALLIFPPVQNNMISVTCTQQGVLLQFENCHLCLENLRELGIEEGQLTVKNCQPCLVDDVEEQNSWQEIFAPQTCPNLNNEDKIDLNFTMVPENTSLSCNVADVEFISDNMSYVDSRRRWNQRKTCDFKCELSDTSQNCFDSSMLTTTFILVLVTMFTSNFFVASAFTMIDATTLQYCKDHNLSLGKQKITGMFGYGFAPFLTGIVLDWYSAKVGYVSYFPAFMLANCFLTLTSFFTYFVTIKVEQNKSNIFGDLAKLLRALDVNMFLVMALLLGCNFGFIESYLFLYLQSLDASNFLLGLTMTVGCVSSIPMLFCADWFERKVGRHFVFLICFTAYAIRMFGYSFIQNPWMCLLFEAFEAITYQLMWVTMLKLCPILAGKGLLATMTGVTGAVHYSFGKGVGGFVGGQLIGAVGMRNAFRVFGGIALSGGVFYMILHYTFFKNRIAQRELAMLENEKEEKGKEGNPLLTPMSDLCPFYTEKNDSLSHLDGLTQNKNYMNGTKKENVDTKTCLRSQWRSNLEIKSVYNTSVPQLYVAGDCDTMSHIYLRHLSRSDGHINN